MGVAPREAVALPAEGSGSLMLRSHRLLREVHRARLDRRGAAASSIHYDPMVRVTRMGTAIRDLEQDGTLDAQLLLSFVWRLADRLLADVSARRALVVARAQSALGSALDGGGRRVPDATRLGRSTALAEDLVDERLVSAVSELLRRMATRDHRQRPAWPAAYRARMGAAAALDAGSSVASGAPPPAPSGDGVGATGGVGSAAVVSPDLSAEEADGG